MKKQSIVYLERNGKKYAYTNEAYWDKEKQQSRSRRKLIGHVDPETGEIVPNRSYKKHDTKPSPSNALPSEGEKLKDTIRQYQRLHFGAAYLLRQIAKTTKLEATLKAIFPNDYQDLLSLAYYLVLHQQSSLMNYPQWTQRSHAYVKHPLSSQRISDLFKRVTEDHRIRFFKNLLDSQNNQEFLVYDTTSISSYSETLNIVKHGHSKEDPRLPQFNLAVLYGQSSRLPYSYRILPGNIPDVSTIQWLLFHLEDIQADKVSLVMDRGHHSHQNILQFLQDGRQFIIGSKVNTTYISQAIDRLKATNNIQDIDVFDEASKVYCFEETLTDHYPTASGKSHYPVKLFLYYDDQSQVEKNTRFTIRLRELKRKIVAGEVLTKAEMQDKKRYFIEKDGVVENNTEAIRKQQAYFGWFALETNLLNLDGPEALKVYRNKDVIEKSFADIKGRLNMRRAYVSSEQSLEGKFFLQFLALYLIAYIKREMDSQDMFKDWTMDQVFNELDLIDVYINQDGEMFVGEVLSKQVKLYEQLKITPPE